MTDLSQVKALAFDVFGTVVDWRTSIINEGEALTRSKGLNVDWAAFADAWRGGYQPAMDRVRSGELPWTNIDGLHRMVLDDLLAAFGIDSLSEAEIDDLNRAWHRLQPWPDAVEGLTLLRQRFVLASLSNGNVALLVNMAKRAGLPWDCVLSAELVRRYKPDAAVYRMAVDLLGLQPHEVMMVAAHNGDLLAAQVVGLQTAFVARPTEYGPDQSTDLTPAEGIDVAARDLAELAGMLTGNVRREA